MLDAYVRRARLYPAVIAAAPAMTLAAILVPWDRFGLPHAAASGAMAIVLAVMADAARRRGKAIEPGVFQRMGGLPSIVMMRFADRAFDQHSKSAMHLFLGSKIGLAPPTPQSESTDGASADEFYRRCGDWLREHTRDTKKYKILFEENMTYGFRRNLYGLKVLMLFLDAAVMLVCFLLFLSSNSIDLGDLRTQKLMTAASFSLVHAAYIIIFVNESGVAEAARTYARQLLLCVDTLRDSSSVNARQKSKRILTAKPNAIRNP